MSEHHARVSWQRQSEGFSYPEYNREHQWEFPHGTIVQASAAPAFLGNGENVDPEEAFVASVSACHMLTLLAICARKRIVVDAYTDAATGFLEKNGRGKLAVGRIELRPKISFANPQPSPDLVEGLHHMAHEECFIANSVTTEISVHEPE